MSWTKPLVPEYIVLDTRECVSCFRAVGILDDSDVHELLTQVFDEFLYWLSDSKTQQPGTMVVYAHRPNFTLLRHRGLQVSYTTLTSLGQIVQASYLKLYESIADMVAQQLFEVIELDSNKFNYVFHSLRANCVVIKHLSDNDPERIF
jgi:hypothetical protein